jgi:N-methylhydantoinase A
VTYHIAVDIGGTFTDLVALEAESGEVIVDKSSSLARDPIRAVLRVIEKTGIPASRIELFVHGTTIATNALIERRGTRVAFVTNRGFRDVIFIQNANRRELYSLDWKKPRPLASRYDCLEVGCRINSQGTEVAPLAHQDVEHVIDHLRREKIRSVAISFLFSYLNPTHEVALALRLREALPDISISLSHEVYPRWRENDRGHTTIADAYLKPMLSRYVTNLQEGFEEAGSPARLLVMKSNGGVVEGEAAADHPANYLVSGPVGGVLGGTHFASLAGLDRIMTIDIGGTSCDVSLVAGGRLRRVANFELELGMPVKAPMVDIRTIGAGGGSIGWIDAGGLLRVGPQSAGSSPGPACYAKGGNEATVTDANLILGRLNADYFCGGDIALDARPARIAVEHLARRLGQSSEETAHAMVELANHNMVDALRVISVERGIDPREFVLVAFGGAGPLHAADIASVVGIGQVLVPPYPGNTSAYGLLTAGLRTDMSTTLLLRADDPGAVARLNEALMPLRARTLATLRREGFKGEPKVEQHLEMRFFGQNYHREIPLVGAAPIHQSELAAAVAAFHGDYVAFYGYDQPGEAIEIVGLIVTAIGVRKGPPAHFRKTEKRGRPESIRGVYFRPNGFQDTLIVQREDLSVGENRMGPMIVEEALSTTVVPPGCRLSVLDSGSMLLELPANGIDG